MGIFERFNLKKRIRANLPSVIEGLKNENFSAEITVEPGVKWRFEIDRWVPDAWDGVRMRAVCDDVIIDFKLTYVQNTLQRALRNWAKNYPLAPQEIRKTKDPVLYQLEEGWVLLDLSYAEIKPEKNRNWFYYEALRAFLKAFYEVFTQYLNTKNLSFNGIIIYVPKEYKVQLRNAVENFANYKDLACNDSTDPDLFFAGLAFKV